MLLIDTHSHVHDREFDADRDQALDRARAAGVECVVALGVDAADSRRALALAGRRPDVLAAAGVHPHDAAEATAADLDALEAMAGLARVALVGEIGLDFYRNLSPRDRQVEVLRRQLETARRAGKPVAVHVREAHEAMLPLLTEHSRAMDGALPDGRPLGVMHYFDAPVDLARQYIDLGFLISVHTSVTHPKKDQIAVAARELPLDQLVLETDSPYGAPQSHRGQRNEPAYVVEAARRVAELKALPVAAVADATTRNARRLLGIEAAVASGRSRA